MKPLETEFRSDGFDFTQIEREGDVALFEKYKPGYANSHYELIIVKTLPAGQIYGKDYPEREGYPSTGQWGQFGWSHCDLESAKKAFDRLVKHRKKLKDATSIASV